jgi:hypothetical protein
VTSGRLAPFSARSLAIALACTRVEPIAAASNTRQLPITHCAARRAASARARESPVGRPGGDGAHRGHPPARACRSHVYAVRSTRSAPPELRAASRRDPRASLQRGRFDEVRELVDVLGSPWDILGSSRRDRLRSVPMSTFDSTKTLLSDLLAKVVKGKLQLPDFQRGWVWDDEHIQSLLVSIARSSPIGAVMLLETGGEARFQVRAVEGVDLPPNTNPRSSSSTASNVSRPSRKSRSSTSLSRRVTRRSGSSSSTTTSTSRSRSWAPRLWRTRSSPSTSSAPSERTSAARWCSTSARAGPDHRTAPSPAARRRRPSSDPPATDQRRRLRPATPRRRTPRRRRRSSEGCAHRRRSRTIAPVR